MLKNILSSIRQQRVSALLNICGLAVALGVTYLILLHYYYYAHWNRGIEDYKRIYRVEARMGKDTWSARLDTELIEKLKTGIPVIQSSFIRDHRKEFTIIEFPKNEEASSGLFAIKATEDNINTLGVEFTAGSREKITDSNGIAIAESYAKKYGIELGDEALLIGNKQLYIVEAMFKDFPQNSDFKNLRLVINNQTNKGDPDNILYIKLRNDSDCKNFIENAAAVIAGMEGDEYKGINSDNIKEHLRLTRLDCTQYTNDLDSFAGFVFDRKISIVSWSIAVCIMAIAFINYFNFFVALIPRRIRNVNICKVMGAQRVTIHMEMILESVMLVSAALIVSLFIVHLLPQEILDIKIPTADKLHSCAVLVAISIVAAIAFAAYPALYATSFPPAFVLKGNFASGKLGKVIRNTLLGIQYVVSFLFIFLSLAQYNHFITLKNKDLGYDEDFYICDFSTYENEREEYTAALKECDAIEDVTYILHRPLIDYMQLEFHSINLNKDIELDYIEVHHNFTKFMGIEVIDGRTFNDNEDGDKFIITEEAGKRYGIGIGDVLSHENMQGEVIGICRDFINSPVGSITAPPVLHYKKRDSLMHLVFFKLTDGHTLSEVTPHIEKLKDDFHPNAQKISINHFDDIFRLAHEEIIVSANTYTVFSLVTMAIALLGVFGMVFFETQYRRKEIAIRRVNGATREDILRIFIRRYFVIVIICYILVVPIGLGLFMVDGTVIKSVTPWIFIIAFAAVTLLTFAIVAASAWKVVNENPSEVISKG